MEERIIDDEFGRKIRLKKTADGYVDVTDELAENGEENEYAEEETEEAYFEYPDFDAYEDDEDLVGLSPEEAAALRKKKEEELAARKAAYEETCKEGELLLQTGSFKAAELTFEKALGLDNEAVEASVGYWRAKTSNFTDADVLVKEYAKEGIESMEYDLGINAVDIIKRDFAEKFQERYAALEEEEKPLAAIVEEKQRKRREVISARLKKSTVWFLVTVIPTAVLLVLTIVFGLKIPTTREDTYIMPTIVLGAAAFLCFIAAMVCTNKWLNDMRMRGKNERLSSTEEGARLKQIRSYKKLYACLLTRQTEQMEQTEETVAQ